MNEDLIFDVGLHIGQDTDFYLKKGFRVVAIEANPKLCEAAREKFRHFIEDGRLEILNVAVSDRAGPMTFYVNEVLSEWSTTSKKWVDRNVRLGARSHEITVEGVDFRRILRDHGITYYMKVDIEGADLLCLEALRDFPDRPKYVSIESNKTSWKGLVREFRLLKSLGYSRFNVVNQADVTAQRCPSPAKEGRFVDHQFQRGSSGLFGEEAPGPWLSEQETLKAYRRIFARYLLWGDSGLFAGLARRIERMSFLRKVPYFWRLPGWMTVPWYDTHAALSGPIVDSN